MTQRSRLPLDYNGRVIRVGSRVRHVLWPAEDLAIVKSITYDAWSFSHKINYDRCHTAPDFWSGGWDGPNRLIVVDDAVNSDTGLDGLDMTDRECVKDVRRALLTDSLW